MVNDKTGEEPVAVEDGVAMNSEPYIYSAAADTSSAAGDEEGDYKRTSYASVKGLSSKRASAMGTVLNSYQLATAGIADDSAEPRVKAIEGIMRENEELENELKDKNEHCILLQSQNVQLWELITKLHGTIVDLQRDLERVASDHTSKDETTKPHLPALAKLKNLDISSVVNGIIGVTPKSPSDRPSSHISQISSTDRSSMNEWSKRSSQMQPSLSYSPSFGNDALKFEESISTVVEEAKRLSAHSATNRLNLDKPLPVSLIG